MTLTLDKGVGKVTLQRKLLFWRRKPIEAAISDVTGVSVDIAVDRASGTEVCHMMLILRTGQGWALSAADKREAQANATVVREFLGLVG